MLACMAYVDLNPIRAGIEELPEESDFTSIQARLIDLAGRGAGRPRKSTTRSKAEPKESARKVPKLYPFNAGFELKESEQALAFSLKDYMELIDWTGRAIREDKRGAIPEQAPPILLRLGFSEEKWLEFVPQVEKSFTHAVGHREKLAAYAQKLDLSWLKGQGRALGYC